MGPGDPPRDVASCGLAARNNRYAACVDLVPLRNLGLTVAVFVGLSGLVTPAATACPPIEACLVNLKTTVREPSSTPEMRRATEVVAALRGPLPAPPRRDPAVVEMPWIWKSLRDRVYSRMPTYEDPNELKVVLAPVVVTSLTDTVPGLGLAGDF